MQLVTTFLWFIILFVAGWTIAAILFVALIMEKRRNGNFPKYGEICPHGVDISKGYYCGRCEERANRQAHSKARFDTL